MFLLVTLKTFESKDFPDFFMLNFILDMASTVFLTCFIQFLLGSPLFALNMAQLMLHVFMFGFDVGMISLAGAFKRRCRTVPQFAVGYQRCC